MNSPIVRLVAAAAALSSLAAPAAALLCSENPAWAAVTCSSPYLYTTDTTTVGLSQADSGTAQTLWTSINTNQVGEPPCSPSSSGWAKLASTRKITNCDEWRLFSPYFSTGTAETCAENSDMGVLADSHYSVVRFALLDTECEDPVPCTQHNTLNGVATTDTVDSAFAFTTDDVLIVGCDNDVTGSGVKVIGDGNEVVGNGFVKVEGTWTTL
jgi:hypothetical protein